MPADAPEEAAQEPRSTDDLAANAPQPSPEEAAAGDAFEALMWALARPGQRQTLPEPAIENVIRALIDRECRVFAENTAVLACARDVGAERGPAETADFAFLNLACLPDRDAFLRLPVGTPLYPDRGATVIAPARFDDGPELRLSGPGVEGALTARIGGPLSSFWAERAEKIRYPLGVDLFLVDGAEVIGVPRSTIVELP